MTLSRADASRIFGIISKALDTSHEEVAEVFADAYIAKWGSDDEA